MTLQNREPALSVSSALAQLGEFVDRFAAADAHELPDLEAEFDAFSEAVIAFVTREREEDL